MSPSAADSRAPGPALWYERIFLRLHLPYYAGVLLVGTLPALAASAAGPYVAGALAAPSPDLPLMNVVAGTAVLPLCLLGSSYLRKRVAELCAYAASRGSALDIKSALARLSSFAYPAVAAVPIIAFGLVFLSPDIARLYPAIGILAVPVEVLALVWVAVVVSTLVWVFADSMYLIHRLAAEPVQCPSFAEDRCLGFRPFGVAAFQLTLVYLAGMAVLAVHVNIPSLLPAPYLLVLLSLFVLAIPLFLLPIWTLHRRQTSAKARELEWIGRRYSAVFASVKDADHAPLSDRARNDLSALASIRQLREDIEKMPTWPFDTDVFARLVAVVLTVSGILLSTVIRDALKF